MPCAYPDEFRLRAGSLIRSGQTVKKTASDLEVSCVILHGPVMKDRIDRGEIPGASLAKSRELRKARKRIRELEDEVEDLGLAHEMLGRPARHRQRVHADHVMP